MANRKNIILLIRSLGLGGAERQLLLLAQELSQQHNVVVMTFYDLKEYEVISGQQRNFEHVSLNKSGRWDIVGFLWRFLREVRRIGPDVIYAFMNTASIIGLAAKLIQNKKISVVWGVRSSNMNLSLYGLLPRLFRRFECRLSKYADLIVSNSFAGRDEATRDGFKDNDFIVIPNGIDIDKFCYKDEWRRDIRAKLDISEETFLIGVVARHDPMKGLECFLEAVALHLQDFPDTRFVLVGSGAENYSNKLKLKAKELMIDSNIHWEGKISDVAPYYSAMDMYTSSSVFGEGFSNTIGEAMSSELPVVVTDVGDARYVVGDLGRIVPPNNHEAIVKEWGNIKRLSSDEFNDIRKKSRKWISEQYSVEKMVKRTEESLVSLS